MNKRKCTLIIVISLLGVVSCETVKPWQRGTLAKPEMQLDADILGSHLHSQVYFSKEASSGGSEVAGAGCGCN